MRFLVLVSFLFVGSAFASEPAPVPAPASVVSAPAVIVAEPMTVSAAPLDATVSSAAPVSGTSSEAPSAPATALPSEAPSAAPSAVVSAPASVPVTDAEAAAVVSKMIDAAFQGHWMVVAGFLLLLATYGFNRLGLAKKLGKGAVPFFTLGLGVGAAMGLAMIEGSSFQTAIQVGLTDGAVAIALWETLVKRFTSTDSVGISRQA